MNHKRSLVFIVWCLVSSALFADESIVALQEKLREIADKESKPVVFISTEKTVKQQSYDPFEFFFNNRGGRPTPKEREFKQSAPLSANRDSPSEKLTSSGHFAFVLSK